METKPSHPHSSSIPSTSSSSSISSPSATASPSTDITCDQKIEFHEETNDNVVTNGSPFVPPSSLSSTEPCTTLVITTASDSVDTLNNDNKEDHVRKTSSPPSVSLQRSATDFSTPSATLAPPHPVTHDTKTNKPYSIFSKRQKGMIVILAALSSFISPFSANIYFPALNTIRIDLNTTAEMISLTVTVYMIFQGLSPSFWGSLSDSWGRRPVYLMTLFIYVLACIGLFYTPNYTALLILRMLQAVGSSSVIAIGAGTIGDIAGPSERGGYMGVYGLGSMLGPILGPVLGGTISSTLGWRWIFGILAIFTGCLLLGLFFLLPETLRSLVGDGSVYANPTPYQYFTERHRKKKEQQIDIFINHKKSRFLVLPNPFVSLAYLMEKDVAVVLMYNALQYASFYCVLTSLSGLLSKLYGLNEFEIGFCYLASGLGAGMGSMASGRIMDWQFKRLAKKMGMEDHELKRGKMPLEFPLEQARMNFTWVYGIFFCMAMITYGWCLEIKIPLPLVLVFKCIMGFSVTATHNATTTLLVDLFPNNSAAIVASNNIVRCLLGAVAVLAINPGIYALGIGWMFTAISSVLFLSRALIIIELKLGPKWRVQRIERIETEKNTVSTIHSS
ncbi:major facilitator superfamily domain-containing protein [Halteromyces radiatus]|uniref:major facilitator superfamily domain-containing protein n=1 Tax=Halteromyces radiatus TaxID=101107 RepID=UPI002220B671|nr:major facilitator superfamily domain-containing protein [Halteromyces radiatus]KAI8086461.1 major facilitator superfamily domain-containing protein [Halteromyces radiatus]